MFTGTGQVNAFRFSFFFYSPQQTAPGYLAWVSQDLLGYDSTTFTLLLKDFSHSCTNGNCPNTTCECGALYQTAAYVIVECNSNMPLEDIVKCWSWMMRLDADLITSSPASGISCRREVENAFTVTVL